MSEQQLETSAVVSASNDATMTAEAAIVPTATNAPKLMRVDWSEEIALGSETQDARAFVESVSIPAEYSDVVKVFRGRAKVGHYRDAAFARLCYAIDKGVYKGKTLKDAAVDAGIAWKTQGSNLRMLANIGGCADATEVLAMWGHEAGASVFTAYRAAQPTYTPSGNQTRKLSEDEYSELLNFARTGAKVGPDVRKRFVEIRDSIAGSANTPANTPANAPEASDETSVNVAIVSPVTRTVESTDADGNKVSTDETDWPATWSHDFQAHVVKPMRQVIQWCEALRDVRTHVSIPLDDALFFDMILGFDSDFQKRLSDMKSEQASKVARENEYLVYGVASLDDYAKARLHLDTIDASTADGLHVLAFVAFALRQNIGEEQIAEMLINSAAAIRAASDSASAARIVAPYIKPAQRTESQKRADDAEARKSAAIANGKAKGQAAREAAAAPASAKPA